ncbi:MAG TPA: hypothetical protein VHU42_00715 [Rhodopila sp.]|nr:hypothetical protein [Rhodopila sp.]
MPPRLCPVQPICRALVQEIAGASDPRVRRIVAKVDAMTRRGPADALIEPLRQRLRMLHPPRPLRFGRLLFHPLDPLIVPGSIWRPGRHAIPRTALMPMAEQVHQALGAKARAIETEIAGSTTADTGLIARLGRSLWPEAARILGNGNIPESWTTTGLREALYRPLAKSVSALLARSAPLDTLCAETANDLLPPNPERIGRMLTGMTADDPAALPMLIALLLIRLPAAAPLVLPKDAGPRNATIRTAMDQAEDRIFRQFEDDHGTEAYIAAGTLADAGAAAARIATLLEQFDTGAAMPRRREQLRMLRRRLDAACKARFTTGLREAFLAPLQNQGNPPDPVSIQGLETIARGLRMLEIEARRIASGPTYDRLLREAVDAIKDGAMLDRLTVMDQARLVEVLAGPDAAMAILETGR